MASAAPHRGPLTQAITLGDTVLGISESESRPDATLAGTDGVAAAFAGTLDNLSALASELAGTVALPPTATPAEVVAGAFRLYGEAAPARLRGSFGAIVTDGRRLLAFRDHLGFGTLFYRQDRGGCYVATEAKQVLAGARIPKEPDLDVLEHLYYQTYDDRTPCALKGEERLPKASVGLFDRDTARLRRYWDPTSLLETARYSPDELQERFDELMAQAVGRMLTGEDIVSLSGGIDSPAIAAYAAPLHRERTGRPLPAVSVVFPQYPSVDETGYVRLVAEDLGLDLHTYEQQANPMDDMGDWVRIADGPFPSVALSQYVELYRFARGLGLRTVLTGELAELVVDKSGYLGPHLLTRGRIGAFARHAGGRVSRGTPIKGLVRELVSPLVPTAITARRWATRPSRIPPWLDIRRVNEAAVRSIAPAGRRWTKLQVSAFVVPGISMEADDICQELCGVRRRRPWADVDLWEFFLSLRAEVKFPDTRGKTLVRRLLRGRVPDAILDRRDKTLFDEAVMKRIDYPALRRWLLDPPDRIPGVDYRELKARLETESLEITDFMWAKDLASVHAFLSQWGEAASN
jgi:asparagine synthetase B (glutamine-hydrolysing)